MPALERRCQTCRWHQRFECVWADSHVAPIWSRRYHPVVSGRDEDCPTWEAIEEKE